MFPSFLIFSSLEDGRYITENVYFYLSGFEISNAVSRNFILGTFFFLFGYLLPLLYWVISPNYKNGQTSDKSDFLIDKKKYLSFTPALGLFHYLVNLACIFGCIIVFLYFFYFGIGFLSLLGSDTSKEDFRFFLYSEEYSNVNLLLEIARRILLPVSVSYFMFKSFIQNNKLSFGSIFLWLILLLAGITTLDRAPIFIAFALLIIFSLVKSKEIYKWLYKLLLWFFVLLVVGGITTQVQYNESIPIDLVLNQGFLVLINTLFFDPALMSLTYSYAVIDGNTDPLLLEFSRISTLWGNPYVGTFSNNAIYVTPVSIVGDIWRNFGHIGILIFSFLLSYLLLLLSVRQSNSSALLKFPMLFMSIVFSVYIIKGTLFSIGPISLLIIFWALTLFGTFDSSRQIFYKNV